MKKLFILLFIAALLPLTARALTDEETANIFIPESQTIEDNYVRAGYNFDLRGVIKGDVIVGGASLDISGKVEGDVLAAAANIKITGEVSGNVRVAGSNVTIEGKVGKNVNVLAATAEFGQDSQVGGSAAVWAGTANFKGLIAGKLDGGMSSIVISGTVKKDINLRFDAEKRTKNNSNLSILSTAVIEGNLNYYGWNAAEIDSSAKISGQVSQHDPEGVVEGTKKFLNTFWWLAKITNLFGLLVIGMMVVFLGKKEAKETSLVMLKSSGKSMLRGLIILFITPVVCFLLLFTVIGIPLALITLVLYIILLYVSQIFIGIFIGQKILEYFRNRQSGGAGVKEVSLFWSMIIGTFLYLFITDFLLGLDRPGPWGWLGLLGGLIKFVALIWAIGALYLVKREKMATSNK